VRFSALGLLLLVLVPATAQAKQRVFFDAKYAKAGMSGPADDMVGHVQFGSGALHDAAGHSVGKFAFTCRWIAILGDGDARERCTGHGTTSDGRVNVAGPALRNAATHTWSVTGGTGKFSKARGTVVVRDLGTTETLVDFAVTPRRGVKLRAGAIPNAAANRAFRARASARCRDAAKTLSALPPFPFTDFDPLHPDPAVLPDVGRFFTGPHDPRPTYEQLKEELVAMGRPPAQRSAWGDLVVAQANSLQNIQRQDDAALAADVTVFVQTVKDSSANFRDVAIAATVFGVPDCVV
jgi:hypothetical protein